MVANAKTRGDATLIISRELEGVDFHTDLATGGATAYLLDTKYQNSIYDNDYFNNWEIHVRTADFTTFVTDFEKATGKWSFTTQSAAAAAGYRYEVRNRAGWTRQEVLDAIALAYQQIPNKFRLDKTSEALAFQRGRWLYTIPSTFSALSRVYLDVRTNYIARHSSGNWDGVTKLRDAAGRTRLAQSFQIPGGNPAKQLQDAYLLLSKLGAPTGNVFLTIESDSNGSPDGTALATSANVDVSTLTADLTYQQFTFSDMPILAKDTTYWLVLQGTFTIASSACVQWANDSTDSGYSYGQPKSYDGATWSAVTGDMIFTVRGTSPNLVPLEGPMTGRAADWTVVREASANKLLLSPAGASKLGSMHDGAALVLIGQGPPTEPTSDSTSLDVPPGYVIAHSCLNLVSKNTSRWSGKPGAQTRPTFWASVVDGYLKGDPTPLRKGSVLLEPF